mmetsp:Transcript_34859/g.105097  ORF Transcript_34859/g.105097 Transcript_34859/m.105097 type:complete len:318 (+) Transcript_34859:227-1180(+)
MSSQFLSRAVEGVQDRTVGGAVVTLACLGTIALLLLGEVGAFFTPPIVHHLGVDDGDGSIGGHFVVPDRMTIDAKATFAHLKCDDLELSIESARGLKDAVDRIEFRPALPAELAGWADPDADPALACTMDGRLKVGKVAAHISVGLTRESAPAGAGPAATLQAMFPGARILGRLRSARNANITHKIHQFRLGQASPHAAAPLDGLVSPPHIDGQQHYILKVIPTVLGDGPFAKVTHQYSLAETYVSERRLVGDPTATPGLVFYYDFFPVMVQVHAARTSVPEFLVSLCAIVGGCVSLAALFDGLVFKSQKALTGKAD